MLVLTRKTGESVLVADDIKITVSSVSGSRVKICVDAPRSKAIQRGEKVLPDPTATPRRPCAGSSGIPATACPQ